MGVKIASKEATVTARNLSGVFLLKVAQFPFLVLFIMFVPRIMGPEIYGKLALFISIITITSALVNIGVGDIHGRFISEHKAKGEWQIANRLFSNMLFFKTIISLFVSVILFFVLYLVYKDQFPSVYFLIICLIVLIRDWASVFFSLLFGLNKLVKFSLYEPVRRVLSLSLILIFFHYYGLLGAIGAIVIVDVSLLVLGVVWTRTFINFKNSGVNISFLMPYLKFGFLLYGSWLLSNCWQRLGNILIDFLTRDSAKVAFFDIANQIFLVVISFTVIIINSLIPIFTQLLIMEKEYKIHIWSNKIIKYMSIINMAFFGSFVLMGSDIIPLLVGNDYKDVFPNVVVLLLGLFPTILIQVGFVYSVVYKKPQRYLQALCAGFVTFLILSIILIPKYFSMGCSIATSASCFIIALVLLHYFSDELIPCLKGVFKVIAPGCFMGLIFIFKGTMITNFFLMFLFIGAYFSALFAMRRLSYEEIQEIFYSLKGQQEL